MPVLLSLQDGFIFAKFTGVIAAPDLVQYAQQAEQLESETDRLLNRIGDLTEIEKFSIDHRDVFQLADRRRQSSRQQSGRNKVAIIAVEPVQIGLARMYQTMSASANFDLAIVRDIDEARAWIGLPQTEL